MKFSKLGLIKQGWELFRKHWQLLVTVTVVAFLLSVIPNIIADRLRPDAPMLAIIVGLVGWAIQIVVGIGLVRVAINLVDEDYAQFRDLFWDYKLFFSYLLASMVVGVLNVLGLVLFIIPGIIVAVRLQFYLYLIIDKRMGALEAVAASWKMTAGSTWNIFLFNVLVGLVTILGALALGVGILVAAPVTMLATTYLYRRLEKTR